MLIVNQNRKLVLNLYCRIVRLTKKEEKKRHKTPQNTAEKITWTTAYSASITRSIYSEFRFYRCNENVNLMRGLQNYATRLRHIMLNYGPKSANKENN